VNQLIRANKTKINQEIERQGELSGLLKLQSIWQNDEENN